MKLALLLSVSQILSAAGQTCTGCTDFGPIGGSGYTMQYGPRMVFSLFQLQPGLNILTLTFVEPVYHEAGKRPISITINDQSILKGFDVFAAGGNSPVVRSYPISVLPDGTATVVISNDFDDPRRNAIVSSVMATPVISVVNTAGAPGAQGPPGPQGPQGPQGPPGPSGGGTGTADDTFSRQFSVSRTDPHTLTVQPGKVSIGGITYPVLGGTIGVSFGTGMMRLSITTGETPYGQVYLTKGLAGGTCTGMGGCVAPVESAQFGDGDIQIATWTVSNGTFDPIDGYTDMRAVLGKGDTIVAGPGLSSARSGHTLTITPSVPPVQ